MPNFPSAFRPRATASPPQRSRAGHPRNTPRPNLKGTTMSQTAKAQVPVKLQSRPRGRRTVDMKLEVVVIPVSDVDRAKRFYGGLGWRLDADFVDGDEFRVVQFTPPGSPCSIHLRQGSHVGRAGLGTGTLSRRVRHRGGARRARRSRRRGERSVPRVGGALPAGRPPSAARIRRGAATPRSPRSAIRTATAGCSRRSPCDCPDAWTRTTRHSPRRPSSRPRSDVRRPRMASTRSGRRPARCELAGLVRRVHGAGAGRQAAAVMSSGYDVIVVARHDVRVMPGLWPGPRSGGRRASHAVRLDADRERGNPERLRHGRDRRARQDRSPSPPFPRHRRNDDRRLELG